MPKTIPLPELWDEATSSFLTIQNGVLVIEHSLLSLHKWEQRWKKPFLTDRPKSKEELVDYIKCMTLNTEPIDDRVYSSLPYQVLSQIKDYIDDPMTATTIHDFEQGGRRETITAELIYFSMIEYGIPFECASWHLNTLITLIRVCGIKGGGGKKMSRFDNGRMQRALNEKRLKKRHR